MRNLFCVLLILQQVFLYVQPKDKFLAVNILYRHGDRTPNQFLPNDPYQDPSFWPSVLGELTNTGKTQHYLLGQWFRQRYDGFLSPIYDKDELYLRSADKDRCVMSAEANLAGLYPPQGKDIWNKDLPWQPIPVHTIPKSDDDIAEIAASCPKSQILGQQIEAMDYFKDIKAKHQIVFDTLTEKTGINVTTLNQIQDIYDTFLIEKIYNYNIPDWAEEIFPDLQYLRDLSSEVFTYTPESTMLSVGRYFDNIKQQFTNLNTNKKFKIFSAHNSQVFSILRALNVTDVTEIPYAAAVMFELTEQSDSKQHVQLYYKNDEGAILKPIFQNTNCLLTDFLENIKNITITEKDFHEKCAVH